MKTCYFDNTDAGAPSLNNVNGSGIGVLIACLQDGYNVKAVTSISVASGVATATCAAHNYSGATGKLVKISGAPQAGLNGNHQPGNITTNTFTYPVTGVADGTYTGTIEARRAPLGWAEEFNDGVGTKSIFRRTAIEALAPKLRIDDSVGASMMRVRAVEVATGIDTVSGLAPTDAQISGGGYWQKGANNATAKKWALFGNDRALIFATQIGTTDTFVYYIFGDGIAYEAGDAWCTMLSVQTNTTVSNTPGFGASQLKSLTSIPGASDALYLSRGRLPASSTPELSQISSVNSGASALGAAALQSETTHPTVAIVNNVLLSGPGYVRGEVPGLASPLANFTGKAGLQPIIAGEHTYVSLPYNNGGTLGCALVRVSGEWH